MKKIIFVCTGGTCRSPMAEHMLKHRLRNCGLSAKMVVVSSAGIMANTTDSISEKTVSVLKDNGIKTRPQKSRQLVKKMVNANTVLIALTDSHKEWIKNLGKVYSLSDFMPGLNIDDPYGKDQEAYVQLYHQLEEVIQIIAEEVYCGNI